MTPSNLPRRSAPQTAVPRLHVAIIMDGNGRWATSRALPRTAGHTAGVRTARNIVESAVRAGIGTLTLYAFSSDNWSRPRPEVIGLMRLFRRSLLVESKRCLENGVRLSIVGRRDRLPASLRQTIIQAEAMTASGRNLHLRIAVDYSSRDAILRAAAKTKDVTTPLTRERFARYLGVSPGSIFLWETGRARPRGSNLARLDKARGGKRGPACSIVQAGQK